jgi:Xaa-Pro aminopeptidase
MRLIKDPSEVAALRKAIQVTRNAFEEAIRALKTAKIERDVEAAFDACARREGIGVGFATIVADGAHAAVLHWTRNDGRIKKGDLVLIDAGAEIAELYTGDITRTLPVSGRFTKEQRAIYDLVTAAQDAAIKVVKPGNDFLEPHRAAMRVLAQGLERLGILPEPAAEAVRDDRQIYKRWTLHNTSHMLGLDVHDGGATNYRDGEPGLYFQPDDLTIPARYRGVGIRVEEDVLVTPSGCRVLSSNIPRTAKEVEAWMAKVWRGR